MTKAQLIAALSDLPDNTPVVLDVGLEVPLDLRVQVAEGEARITPADDPEGSAFIEAVGIAFV